MLMADGGHGTTVRGGVPAAIREAARDLAEDYGVLRRPLVYVTGKGGVGKTTVASALALATAAQGQTALVCELSGADQLARVFGCAPAAPGTELALGRNLSSLSVEPDAALGEWLARRIGAPAARLLRRSRAFGYFVAAALALASSSRSA